jgi:anti-anti-sigma factor
MAEATISIQDLNSGVEGKTLKTVAISGQLDESNVDEKSNQVYALLNSVPSGLFLIFDLENLEYMNSKSIGYLTDWYGKITDGGGKVYLIKAKPNILDILQVVGLTQLIETFATFEEAKTKIEQDLKV